MAHQIEPADGACDAAGPRRDAKGRFVAAHGARPKRRAANRKTARKGPPRNWRDLFLAKLAETSNITVACKAARIDTSQAYKERRDKPDVRTAWRGALLEGYENLELETLCRLRHGELRNDERKFDIANALRLLKVHAEEVARERARREDRDEQDVLDSLDRMIESMRERAAANAAIPAEPDDDAR